MGGGLGSELSPTRRPVHWRFVPDGVKWLNLWLRRTYHPIRVRVRVRWLNLWLRRTYHRVRLGL